MPAAVLYEGPTPPHGRKWCFVCAYEWKAAVNERHALTIEQAQKEPDGTTLWIHADTEEGLPPLAVAVATGLFAPMSNMGQLDLCWSHLTAIRLQSTGGLHLPVPGQGMPGMNGAGGLLG
jgi:hypothetical protein